MELLSDIQGTVVTNQISMEKMNVMMRSMLKKMNQMEEVATNPPTKASVAPEQTVPARETGTLENPTEADYLDYEDQD